MAKPPLNTSCPWSPAPSTTVGTAGDSTTTGSPSATPSNNSDKNFPSARVGDKSSLDTLSLEGLRLQLGHLKIESARLSELLSSVRNTSRPIVEEIWRRKFGIAPGVLVLHHGKVFIVDYPHHNGWGTEEDSKPWLHGFKVRVDGTPAAKSQHLFDDWELVA